MQVSSIRGADSLNFNPNITSRSFNRINSVKGVVKQPQQMQADDVILSDAAAQLLQQSSPTENTPVLAGEEPGTSYGFNASDLRRDGMRYQLLGQEVADDPAMELMGNPAGEQPQGPGMPQQPAQAEGSSPAGVPEAEESEEAATALTGEETAESEEDKPAEPGRPTAPSGEQLSDEEVQMIRELEARDIEVRTHEQAHIAAGGGYTSGSASFSYQKGPDGQRYAIGGEVQIDTSPEATPEATIQKMQTVRQAALAPAQPSGQDRSVAAAASQAEMEARQEMQEATSEEAEESKEGQAEDSQETSETGAAESGEKSANSKAASPAESNFVNPDNYTRSNEQNPAASTVAEAAAQTASTNPANSADGIVTPTPATPEVNSANAAGMARLSYTQQAARAAYGISA